MDVVLVLWPDQAPDLGRLVTAGTPRLLLVAPEAPPPEDSDCLQDWIRLPAADQDVRARVVALERRSANHGAQPVLGEEGLVTYHGQSTWLSPVERLLLETLCSSFGTVVPLEALVRRAWPDDPPGPNTVRVHILRLRRRIAPLGLAIHNVQGKGYVLAPRR